MTEIKMKSFQVKCENCGASNDINMVGEVCEYCGSSIKIEDYEANDKVLFELDGGMEDILTVYTDRILIQHKGKSKEILGIGSKIIYLSDITAIKYKKPRLILGGYIQFLIAGGIETDGFLSAYGNENTVFFLESSEKVEEILNYLNNNIGKIKTKKSEGRESTSNAADEIQKFKSLLDQGIITQQEFKAKKKQLLGL